MTLAQSEPKIGYRNAQSEVQAIFCRRRHQPRRPPLARSTLVKSEKLKTSTSVRLAAESDKSPHQHGECGNRSTLLKKSKTEERKGSRGGNCLKGWMLAVARCSGALVPNISGSMGCDCGPLRGATARKRPCHSGGYRTVGIVGG